MKSEIYSLKQLASIKYGKNQRKVESQNGYVPIYGTGGLMGYAVKALYDKPSVLIGRKGTIDKIRYVEHPFWTVDTLFYTEINTDLVLPRYFYYLMKQVDLLQLNEGTTIPSLRTETLNRLEFEIPDLKEQKRRLSLIVPIEDKIALNNRVNQNLEQQAIMIFRSWFVDFALSKSISCKQSEFGLIPDNFTVCNIGSLPIFVTDYVANGSFASLKENVTLFQEPNYAYFIRNTDLKSGSFKTFVDRHSYDFLSKSTLYGDEIIISNVGDVGSVFLCPKLDRPMTLGNNIIMLRPDDEKLRYYLYVWFKYQQGQSILQGIKGGSAQPKFNKTDFKNSPILLPPSDLLSNYNKTVGPMFKALAQNQLENSRLIAVREALLPKLMSGELDVSKIDI